MSQTTYRALVLASYLIPLLFLGLHFRDAKFAPQTQPDTQSYVLSSPYRASLYSSFLNLTTSEDQQRSGLQRREEATFSTVVALQKLTFMLSVLVLFGVCHKLLPFSQVFLILLALIFRKELSNLLTQVSWVLPEGLSASWIILLLALSLSIFHHKNLRTALLLSLILFLGVLLSPRLICFAPLVGIAMVSTTLKYRRMIPAVLLLTLLLSQCLYHRIKNGVFSLGPLNGIYTIGSALRFLSPESANKFHDQNTQSFVQKAFSSPIRKTEIKANEWITWTFATQLYRETFSERFQGLVKGKDVLHMNQFYAGIFPTLLLKDDTFRQSWLAASFRQIWSYLRSNLWLNFLILGSALVALFGLWKHKQTVLYFPLLFAAVHFFNVFLTVPFCGIVQRFLTSTHFLVIPILFSLGLYFWDKIADWILNQLVAFKRRSTILENSSAG